MIQPENINVAIAQQDLSRMGWELRLGSRVCDMFVVSDVTMTEVEPGTIFPPSPLILSHDATQSLMDSLWNGGVRPTNDRGHAGEVEYLRSQLDRATRFAFEEIK